MNRTSGRRRTARLTTVLLACLMMLTVAAPSQAAWQGMMYGTVNSAPFNIKGSDGVTYQVVVSMRRQVETAMYGFDRSWVSVEISKTKDPSGVKWARQDHNWSWELEPQAVKVADDLSTASIDTGTTLGKFGRIKLTFAKNGSKSSSCNGHQFTRPLTVTGGTMNFVTNRSLWGKITKEPTKATGYGDDGMGDCSNTTTSCPTSSRSLSAHRSNKPLTVWASRNGKQDYVFVYLSSYGTLVNNGWLSHSIAAKLPATKFSFKDDLSSGAIAGAKGTWISGSMSFTAQSPATSTPPLACGSGKEYYQKNRSGSAAGNLKANFFGFPDRTVGEAPMDGAAANRTIVRNAS